MGRWGGWRMEDELSESFGEKFANLLAKLFLGLLRKIATFVG